MPTVTARPASLAAFFAWAVLWLVLLTVVWTRVSAWTSYPVATLTHIALGAGAKEWVRTVHKAPGRIEVDTRIVVPAPNGQGRGELIVDSDPAHYTYGLPLFLALLLASRAKRLLGRALAGYALLLPPQVFSLTLDLLKQMAMATPGGPTQLGIAQWQLEAIALGYQLGSLLLPTLAPVAFWLWFDRAFFVSVLVQGWMNRQVDGASD